MRRIQTALVLVVVSFVQLVALVPARAAQTPTGPLNLTISPHSQEIVTKPGTPVNVSFQLKNNGPETETLQATIKTFSANGQDGTPQLHDPKPSDEYVKWVTLPQPTFSVEPGTWQTFTFTISPPKTAAFGYYYAVDFTRAVQNKAENGNTVLTTIDGLVLLNVKAGGEARKLDLKEFSTPNRLIEFLPQNFVVRMHNTGNVHVSPRGNVYIYKGKESIATIEVNAGGGNLLPDSYRKFTPQWKDGTPAYKTATKKTKQGELTDDVRLKWDDFKLSKLRFGKYTAELQMVYNNGQYDVPLTAKLSFWVIPWRILAVLLVVLLLVLAGLWVTVLRPLTARFRGNRRGHGRHR